ncbi:MAG: universal stress protein [Planctomycetota bacterium]|nr:universal stress protein [Planctomycetota bacterium]MDA0920997.1 universal stress protein [Planctomycetota bacterium]MDA1161371.1 universal stress protein [Planctomycetota bacterium]
MFSFNRILIPVDFGAVSQAAVEAGAKLAGQTESEIFLLHALAPVAVIPPLGMMTAPVVPFDDASAARMRLENLPVPQEMNLTVRREVVHGDASRVIVDFADEHDVNLIVMGTHSRSGFESFILGSVTESVVRHAKCPVLTIPAIAVACSAPDFEAASK